MEQERNMRIPVIPYKQIGGFCGNRKPTLYNIDKLYYLAMPIGKSFKVLALPEMRVRLLGPTLKDEITSIQAYNENLYVASGTSIFVFNHLHLIDIIEFDSPVTHILLYDTILIVSLGNEIRVLSAITKEEISKMYLEFEATGISHPPTYLNKVIVFGERSLELWNVLTGNRIFKFDSTDKIGAHLAGESISVFETSNIVDYAAIGCVSGKILIVNLKKDKVVAKFEESNTVTSISFSTDITCDPMLVTGNTKGDLTFWNLNENKIAFRQASSHQGGITFLKYLEYERNDIFISGSGEANCIKFWHRQDKTDTSYIAVRIREGAISPLQKIRFYGEDSRHIIGYSNNSECELFDFSVLREEMTIRLSNKESKNQQHKTERNSQLGEIVSVDFSLGRERHWSNLISANKYSNRPCFWDVPNRSINKVNIQTFSNASALRESRFREVGMKKRFVTSVAISQCGNYGIAGFSDGYIVKVTMQTGTHQRTFVDVKGHSINDPVRGLSVDALNHFLISNDDNCVIRWDFFGGKLQLRIEEEAGISKLIGNPASSYFAYCTKTNIIKLVELHRMETIREFKEEQGIEINECVLLLQDRKIIVATGNKLLKVWDIFSEQLIFTLKLDREIISMDVNREGTLLGTVFRGDKTISMWNIHKLTLFSSEPIQADYVTPVKFRGRNKRAYYFGPKEEDEETTEIKEIGDELYEAVKAHLDEDNTRSSLKIKKELKLTEIPSNRWMPLRDIEAIEERNRPTKDEDISVPFFLEFDNPLTRMKKAMEGDVMEKEKSTRTKVIKNAYKTEFMEELSEDFIALVANIDSSQGFSKVNKKAMRKAFKVLKSQTASKINYLLRQLIFEDLEAPTKLLMMFTLVMSLSDDYDIKCTIFHTFLKHGYDKVSEGEYNQKLLTKLNIKITSYSEKVNQNFHYLSCMIDKLSEA